MAETAKGWRGNFVFRRGFRSNFSAGGGGRIEVAICDLVGKLDRTARSPTSRTLQSTSLRGGGGWNGWGMVWQLCEGERLRRSTSLMIARLWVMMLSAMTPIW